MVCSYLIMFVILLKHIILFCRMCKTSSIVLIVLKLPLFNGKNDLQIQQIDSLNEVRIRLNLEIRILFSTSIMSLFHQIICSYNFFFNYYLLICGDQLRQKWGQQQQGCNGVTNIKAVVDRQQHHFQVSFVCIMYFNTAIVFVHFELFMK